MGWTVRTAAEWADQIRTGLDAVLGYSVDYDGTLEGDWTATVGAVAFGSDQGMQIALDERSPLTATGSALDAAVAPIVYRKAAVSSRYTVTAVAVGSVAAEAIYRDTTPVAGASSLASASSGSVTGLSSRPWTPGRSRCPRARRPRSRR